MNLGLETRCAVVTGAASGIGQAVARALTREGARVALLDRDDAALAEVAAQLPGSHPILVDVTDETQVVAAIAQAQVAHGGIDIVVGSAGVSGPVGTSLSETTRDQWDTIFAVNVTGTYLLLKHSLAALARSELPAIVVVASDSALVATAGMVPYCASKAAVLQLARAFAVEAAPAGIRVNAICPSIVDTPMSRGDLDLPQGFHDLDYPVQTSAEVADQVVFLASPRSRSINATSLVADFGYSARSNFPA